jgi:transposase InsO family protein
MMVNTISEGNKAVTKTELAKKLGIARSSLYYQHKRPVIDEEVKKQIEAVLTDNPAYGHKRIALALKLNKKRILRVMKKFGLKPYKRRVKKPRKKEDEKKPIAKYQNLVKDVKPVKRNEIWVSDFTYIRFKEKFIYLATIMDLFSREIVGFNISRFHNSELVLGALDAAAGKNHPPGYLHSDQGSEYDSQRYTNLAEGLGIKISMSAKSSPWENAYQESFYSQFKVDLGRTDRFNELGELIEAISGTLLYYNTKRIHTSLKMPPEEYRKRAQEMKDSSSRKMGT